MTAQTEPHAANVPPPVAMLQMIAGFWVSRAIYVAAKLGLADHVHRGPKTADELAAATGMHGPSLYRVLRALASVGIFVEDDRKRFASTPLAETLRTDAPGSLRAFATVELGEEHYPAWGELLHSVRTGGIAFDKAFGMPVWSFFEKNPDNARTFNEAMTNMTLVVDAAILGAYDFSAIGKLMDVGGGHGSLLASILKAHPRMRGVLFDVPSVIEGAHSAIEAQGLSNRCERVAGDFFASVPAGVDACILKFVIHDWDDDKSLAILKNCHRALKEHGRLLLAEAVVPQPNELHLSKFIDLNMLVMTGGRERTVDEYRALLKSAGFNLNSVKPTQSLLSVIECERA